MRAIVVRETGGPEQLRLDEIDIPKPGSNEVLVKLEASGVNFIDVYFRKGLYPATPPFTPGSEGAGVIQALGEDVIGLEEGERVAWAMMRGSYAEYAVVPAWMLVPVPKAVSLEAAAAAMLQGMTAHYLVRSTYPLKAGETALVHAAAGGVGLLLIQMIKQIGGRVIGTASTEEKAALAKSAGAVEVVIYREGRFEEEVRRLAGDRGIEVVYDGVGAATFEQSINCLKPRGMMVTFGNASGPVKAFDPLLLSQKGSLFLTRPSLANYCTNREELIWRATEVLVAVGAGELQLHVHKVYPLAEARQAHIDLEARGTTGKLVLRMP